ncbi:MAG TPA: TolC family protein [Phycisphaerae bacterium]|nr:TolC family protein [Phycisphaerae bacterium]
MNKAIAAPVLLLAGAVLAGCAGTPGHEAYRRFAGDPVCIPGPPGEKGRAAAPQLPADLTEESGLNDYLAYAALHNADLESAFSAWKAALERIPQVRALPDPRFTYRNYVEAVETRVGPQRNSYEISQTFPWLGKLDLRGDVAAEEAKAARCRLDAARLKLFYQIRKVYAEYYYLWRSIKIAEDNIELLKQLESVARTRYTVGAAGHSDVIRAQVEQGKLADRLRTLEKTRAPMVARLNAALNRPTTAPLPWPRAVLGTAEDFTDETLLAWAAEANPEVQAADREIAALEHGVDLARKDYFPDVTLGVNYIDTGPARAGMRPADSGKDPVIAMMSVNIPIWWDKLAAGVHEAQWRKLGAISRKTAILNNLSADVELALFGFQDAGRKIGLYRDTLIPKAEEALKATQTAYSGGRAGFQDYLDAQRILLDFQLSYERSLADRAQRLGELEMLVGKPLTKEP